MKINLGLAPKVPSIADIGGTTWPILDVTPTESFNPSIGYCPEKGYGMLVRKSNYKLISESDATARVRSGTRRVSNIAGFAPLDNDLNPISWTKVEYLDGPIQKRGVEDARLFYRDGSWHFSAVMLESHTPVPRISVFKLSDNAEASYLETYPGMADDTPEKNWMTEMYSTSNSIEFVKESPHNIRGGSCLVPHEGGYVAVGHRTYMKQYPVYDSNIFGMRTAEKRSYTSVFLRYDKNKNLIGLSEEITMRPEGGIEFVAGMVEKDGDFYISYGVNDAECWLAKISTEIVDTQMKEIK